MKRHAFYAVAATLCIAAIAIKVWLNNDGLHTDSNSQSIKMGEGAGIGQGSKDPPKPGLASQKGVRAEPSNSDILARLPPGNFPSQFGALSKQAENGDDEIAYALAVQVSQCMNLDGAMQDLATEIKSMGLSESDATSRLSQLEEEQARCAGLTSTQRQEALRLLELAAEHGYVPAQLSYVVMAIPDTNGPGIFKDPDSIRRFREKAIRYLTRAAESGSVTAMGELAAANANGILVEKNNQRAYALAYAASLCNRSSLGGLLAEYSRGLSSNELDVARQQGSTFFEKYCR